MRYFIMTAMKSATIRAEDLLEQAPMNTVRMKSLAHHV